MNKLVDEVLAGRRTITRGDFAVNQAGLELEAQGLSALRDMEAKLSGDLSHAAHSISTPAGLATRYPGLDYVLRYYLRFGMNADPDAAVARISNFPKPLLVTVLSVSCHAFRAVKPVTPSIPIPPAFVSLVVRLSRCDEKEISERALRTLNVWRKAEEG